MLAAQTDRRRGSLGHFTAVQTLQPAQTLVTLETMGIQNTLGLSLTTRLLTREAAPRRSVGRTRVGFAAVGSFASAGASLQPAATSPGGVYVRVRS